MLEAVFFDIDDTLIKGQSSILFVEYLFRAKKLNISILAYLIIWMFFYKIKLVKNVKPAMKRVFRAIKGWNLDESKALVNDFFEKDLKYRIYPQALAEIKRHKKEKRKIVLISNAPQIIVDKILEAVGGDYGFGTEPEIKNGVFTGEVANEPMYAGKKVEIAKKISLENNWDLDGSWAYSDHYSDIGLLELVGNPVAVNPDSKLLLLAQGKKWPIINFSL